MKYDKDFYVIKSMLTMYSFYDDSIRKLIKKVNKIRFSPDKYLLNIRYCMYLLGFVIIMVFLTLLMCMYECILWVYNKFVGDV